MAIYKCLVNGEIDADVRQEVRAGLTRITGQRFGTAPEDVTVEFIEVEEGRWYTAGEQSRSSMVLGSVPLGTTEDTRAEVMNEIATFYSAATGTDYDSVMVVAADQN